MEDLAGLRLSRCVDFHPSDEAASFCGFDNPSTLTVEYRTATGAEETFVMDIGNQNMDGTGRYVRVGGESARLSGGTEPAGSPDAPCLSGAGGQRGLKINRDER